MRKEIVRLALLQMVLIIYSILGVAVLLRIFQGSPAPAIFATRVRDWGFLLLFASAGWCAWASYEMGKPAADHRTGIDVLFVGLCVAGVIAVVAIMATISASKRLVEDVKVKDLMIIKPTPKPSITHREIPPDP